MPGLQRRYERVEDDLLNARIQKNAPVGQAVARLINAQTMLQYLAHKIQADPLYLINVFNP